MRASLWELESLIADAAENLDHASRMALEISGHDPGQDADPEWGRPAQEPVDGWPAMVRLCDLLGGLSQAVKAAVPPEVEAAIKEEKLRDDGRD